MSEIRQCTVVVCDAQGKTLAQGTGRAPVGNFPRAAVNRLVDVDWDGTVRDDKLPGPDPADTPAWNLGTHRWKVEYRRKTFIVSVQWWTRGSLTC
jgi:hypothetical protein